MGSWTRRTPAERLRDETAAPTRAQEDRDGSQEPPKPEWVLALLLLLPAWAWAEYCKNQGQNPLPRKEAKQYEDEAWLGPSEIVESQRRHLPWGLPDPQCRRPAAVPLSHQEYVVCYDLSRKVGPMGVLPS